MDQNVQFYDDFADFYDLMHPGRDSEHTFYATQVQPGDRVLEVACGTGTLAQTLVNAGATVTGLDASESMLDIARHRLPELSFLQADMRDFSLPEKFDKVFCLFNSLMHLHDDADVVDTLTCLGRHCDVGGEVVIDVFGLDQSRFPAKTSGTEVLDLPTEYCGRHLKVIESTTFVAEQSHLSVSFEVKDGVTLEPLQASHYSVRFFTPEELDKLFAQAGLEITGREDTYLAGSQVSDFRQIIHARPKR